MVRIAALARASASIEGPFCQMPVRGLSEAGPGGFAVVRYFRISSMRLPSTAAEAGFCPVTRLRSSTM
jgi:hypothetical protein